MHGRAWSCSCRPLFVKAYGDLANFNPHLHVLAADGVFAADGTFTALPPVPEALLAEGFRQEVLAFLVKAGAIAHELRARRVPLRIRALSMQSVLQAAGRRPRCSGCRARQR